jgi:hypothetical protein
MGREIDDSVKQKLLDSLAKEPPMVISTAYAYAKNYVLYGEDITKAWTTAVQQASVIQEVRQKAWVEAYDSFKKEYKTDLKIILNRLKVRMKDRDEDNGGEPLNGVDKGYHLAYEHLCEEIDNLLKENEDATN